MTLLIRVPKPQRRQPGRCPLLDGQTVPTAGILFNRCIVHPSQTENRRLPHARR